VARGARHIPDGLKISSVLMKTTELTKLRKMVKAGEQRPLTAADPALLLRIRSALRDYEAQTGGRQEQFTICKKEVG
jgi:hypothetical protein